MIVTKYDQNNPILPEGLEYRWQDAIHCRYYDTKRPTKWSGTLLTVLRQNNYDWYNNVVVEDGDLILTTLEKKEIVKKGSLAYKSLEGECNPCKAIDLGPGLQMVDAAKFEEGDIVKTKVGIKTAKDLQGVEGVVVSLTGMVGVDLLGIEGTRFFQPEELYHKPITSTFPYTIVNAPYPPLFPTITKVDMGENAFKEYHDKFQAVLYPQYPDTVELLSKDIDTQNNFVSGIIGSPTSTPEIKTFNVGDRVRTNDTCKYEADFYLGAGVVESFYGAEDEYISVKIDGNAYAQPYLRSELDHEPTWCSGTQLKGINFDSIVYDEVFSEAGKALASQIDKDIIDTIKQEYNNDESVTEFFERLHKEEVVKLRGDIEKEILRLNTQKLLKDSAKLMNKQTALNPFQQEYQGDWVMDDPEVTMNAYTGKKNPYKTITINKKYFNNGIPVSTNPWDL